MSTSKRQNIALNKSLFENVFQVFPGQISEKLSADKSIEAAAVWDVLHSIGPDTIYAKHFVGHMYTRHDMIQTFAKKLLMHETAERVLAPGTLTLKYAQKLFLYLHYCHVGYAVSSSGIQNQQLDFIKKFSKSFFEVKNHLY